MDELAVCTGIDYFTLEYCDVIYHGALAHLCHRQAHMQYIGKGHILGEGAVCMDTFPYDRAAIRLIVGSLNEVFAYCGVEIRVKLNISYASHLTVVVPSRGQIEKELVVPMTKNTEGVLEKYDETSALPTVTSLSRDREINPRFV